MNQLAIAIVTYKSVPTIISCLRSISEFAPFSVVTIVDNSGEGDRVREALMNSGIDLDWRVIEPNRNLGYAGGINAAVADPRVQSCTYLLILNPDVRLLIDPIRLTPALAGADVVSGVLISPTHAQFEGTKRATNVKRSVTYSSSLVQALFGTRWRGIEPRRNVATQSVPQVDGAYMLQTMQYYRSNPLSAMFELYYEDVEYCDRARAKNGVRLVNLLAGIHASGSSAEQSNGLAHVASRVSWARYLRQKYPRLPRSLVSVPFLLEYGTRTLAQTAEGSRVRRKALVACIDELRNPGSVVLLQGPSKPVT